MERQSYIILAAIILAIGAAVGLTYIMSKPAGEPPVATAPSPTPTATPTTKPQPSVAALVQPTPTPKVAPVTASADTGPSELMLAAAVASIAAGAFGLRASLKQR